MSTRAQVHFQSEYTKGIYIYKHCDGYPEGVLPLLKDLLKKFKKHHGYNAVYLTARYVQEIANEVDNAVKDPEYKCVGIGIDNALHGDIEYLYMVTEDWKISIYVPNNKAFDKFWDNPTIGNMILCRTIPLEEVKSKKPLNKSISKSSIWPVSIASLFPKGYYNS